MVQLDVEKTLSELELQEKVALTAGTLDRVLPDESTSSSDARWNRY